MEKSNIVINTLVFLDEINKGVKQSSLLRDINSLGISKAEVRREFIRDFEVEIKEIREISRGLKMELYYSVPKCMYINGRLASDDIEKYFREAYEMKCRNVKLNIGDYRDINSGDAAIINFLCDKYQIKLTIENDQTAENGRVEKIKEFLEHAQRLKVKISATFDVGNWLWQNQDPLENANTLRAYVTYIHLKDVKIKDKPQATLLDKGIIPWRSILDIFDKNLPVAIEYPCSPNALLTVEDEIRKLEALN
ncbi:sugar phosphate isomerase/epimerase family protein [Fonticella tunisiensis]|uniref:Sugar phosphate isomerase/epimerase n=1 Tax=Fonticella tunisiensis TaxID=1096341 RepID=A0A4R7KW87_9CLOT|nr:TIM barrel protein [Fonticella tunisiensis]TDT62885.1 sugar phosphate isomerase/epimerase [Fonticella tunisiensis]